MVSKEERSRVEDSRDRSHSNARQELLAAVAVADEGAVHRQAAVGEDGGSAGGDRGNGEQGGEDEGLNGSSPV
jgi:hypothetical protein